VYTVLMINYVRLFNVSTRLPELSCSFINLRDLGQYVLHLGVSRDGRRDCCCEESHGHTYIVFQEWLEMISRDGKNLDMVTDQSLPGDDGSCPCILSTEPVVAHGPKSFRVQDVLTSQHDRPQSPSIDLGEGLWLVGCQEGCIGQELFLQCSAAARGKV